MNSETTWRDYCFNLGYKYARRTGLVEKTRFASSSKNNLERLPEILIFVGNIVSEKTFEYIYRNFYSKNLLRRFLQKFGERLTLRNMWSLSEKNTELYNEIRKTILYGMREEILEQKLLLRGL